uniref:Uncharacterized protein n=1 Tax=Candidatus Berkiella aquae TaxID=295108 RepID=A0A0Q9YJ31_9GAMM
MSIAGLAIEGNDRYSYASSGSDNLEDAANLYYIATHPNEELQHTFIVGNSNEEGHWVTLTLNQDGNGERVWIGANSDANQDADLLVIKQGLTSLMENPAVYAKKTYQDAVGDSLHNRANYINKHNLSVTTENEAVLMKIQQEMLQDIKNAIQFMDRCGWLHADNRKDHLKEIEDLQYLIAFYANHDDSLGIWQELNQIMESPRQINAISVKTTSKRVSSITTSETQNEPPLSYKQSKKQKESVPKYDFKAKKNALADVFKPPVKPSTSSDKPETSILAPSTPNTDILQFQSNVQRLIHGKAIEIPSHMSTDDLQDYLLGKKSIDTFIQKKGSQGTKRTAAVGSNVNPEEQQRLLSELQQAFNKRGISSTKLTQQEPSPKQPSIPKKTSSSQAASSSPVEPSLPSLPEPQDITPDIIKTRLTALSNEGVIGINFPLEGDSGIINFLFNKDVQLEKRKIDSKLKDPALKAAIQPGALVQDKKAFLSHAKQFGSVRNLLAEKEKEKEQETKVKRPKAIRHHKVEDLPPLSPSTNTELKQSKKRPKPKVEDIAPLSLESPNTELKQSKKRPKPIISSEKENISPNNIQPQNSPHSPPQSIYGQSWQQFCDKLEGIQIEKKDGTITNNAYKKILGFLAKNNDGKSKTPAQEHQRLQELRDMLLGMHTVKNADLKDAIKIFIEDYKKLPPPLSRSLSIKKR